MSDRTFAVGWIVCALASCPCARLTAQVLDLAQYAHTAWRLQDGAPGGIRDLAQGADGVLWIASERGLFQFDGVRFDRYEPPPGQALLPRGAQFLLALPDTSLWVGHFTSGVSVVHRGRVVTYDTENGLPGGTVTSIARDSGGTMWVATTRGLARLTGRQWEQMDTAAGFPGGFIGRVLVDRSGSVWAMAGSEVYVLPRGAARFRKWEKPAGRSGAAVSGPLIAAPDGSVWGVHKSFGVFPVADARGAPLPGTLVYPDTGIYDLVWSRDHPAVALGTQGRLLRLWLPDSTNAASAAAPVRALEIPFSHAEGMSGSFVFTALYDREGSLWIGTPSGVDRFRETKLTPLRLPGNLDAPGLAADTSAVVWISARHGSPAALLRVGDHIVVRPDAPSILTCIYGDLRGGIWIGGSGVWQLKGDAFEPVPLPAALPRGSPYGREVQAIARDPNGRLWVSIAYDGVFRRPPGRDWERFAPPGLDAGFASVITSDRSGRTWVGYPEGQLVLVAGDSIRLFQPAQLALGRVLAISVYGDRVWIGGQDGVAALDARGVGARGGGKFALLHTGGEPLRGISGLIETADGELWLNGADGVTRIPAPELRRALADPRYPVHYERLDYRDGLEPPAQQIRPLPSAVAGTDGRIWFASEGGVVAWVDPRKMHRNLVPPPVQLRALTAGRRRYFAGQLSSDTLRLPPRPSALSVAYTAYSLAVPDRVRFKYRLEGLDPSWQDAGGRREAFFTNLAPGHYRFQVIAANDDGVWNTRGASLAFTIAAAWNQTWWFFALLACTLLALPALAAVAWQRRRARLGAAQTRARYEAILAERTRVARELHDTLLGSMTGVVLQLEAGARHLDGNDAGSVAPAAELLSTLASQTREALTHTRQTVAAMRGSARARLLHEQLAAAVQPAFSGSEVVVHLTETGTARGYPPAVETEIVGIASEAMTNARRHSGCRTVWVTCGYDPGELRISVRDDGKGFDSSQPSPAGHWGLIGMSERAASIGATLTIASAPGAGTEVFLVLPQQSGRWAVWSRLINILGLRPHGGSRRVPDPPAPPESDSQP